MKYFTAALLSFTIFTCKAQLVADWQNNAYLFPGGFGYIEFDNGGNTLLSRTEIFSGSGLYGHAVVKFDPEGSIAWSAVEENPFDDYNFGMKDVAMTPDNGIVLVGTEQSGEDAEPHGAIMMINDQGNVSWSQYASASLNQETLNSVVVKSSGDIYASGILYNDEIPGLSAALVKFSSDGELQWTHFDAVEGYGSLYLDEEGTLYAVNAQWLHQYDSEGMQTDATPIVFTGVDLVEQPKAREMLRFTPSGTGVATHVRMAGGEWRAGLASFPEDGSDAWTLVIDSYTDSDEENIEVMGFETDTDGNFYLSGNFYANGGKGGGAVFNGVWEACVTAGGELLWHNQQLNEDGPNGLYSVASVITNADQYLVVYNTGITVISTEVVKSLNTTSGDVIWENVVQQTDDFNTHRPLQARINNDGEIFISGDANLFSGKGDLQYIYLNKYEAVTEGVEESELHVAQYVYPNPCHDLLSVSLSSGSGFAVYDVSGRRVIESKTTVNGNFSIDTSSLSPGLYSFVTSNGATSFIRE